MPLTKMDSFTFNHADQADRPQWTAAETKQNLDARGEELRVKLNEIIDTLLSITDGDSGADNIGATAITDLDGTTVQAILESIRNKLRSITDGASGADFVKATPINTADTVQGILEELKALIDDLQTQITSNDNDIANLQTSKADASSVYTKTELDGGQLDNRYYTETELNNGQLDNRYFTESELQSTTDGSSGADKIGATAIDGYTTVQSILENLKSAIDALEAQLPDGQDIPYTLTRIDDLEAKYDSSQYSTPATEIAEVIHLPSNTVKGQVNASLYGRTYVNLVGNIGDCEVDSNSDGVPDGWDDNTGILQDPQLTTDCAIGSKAFRGTRAHSTDTRISDIPWKDYAANSYYFASAYLKAVSGEQWISIVGRYSDDTGESTLASSTGVTDTTKFVRVGAKVANGDRSRLRFDWHAKNQNDEGIIDGAMLVEITEDEYNNLTVDELMQKYSFINSVKSTINMRLKSVGKNLCLNIREWTLHSDWSSYKFINDNGIEFTTSGSPWQPIASGNKKVKSNTNYTFSIENIVNTRINIRQYNSAGEEITRTDDLLNTSSYTITTSANTDTIEILIGAEVEGAVSFENPQLEQGDTATEYEPYKESETYTNVPLRSLPNGVKDEVSVVDGKFTKRVNEKAIENADIIKLDTSPNNVDYVVIDKPSDFIGDGNDNHNTGQVILEGYGIAETTGTLDDTQYENKLATHYSTADMHLVVPKGTYKDLASAQEDLAGKSLIYQLAKEEEYDLNITPLTAYENGTLYVEPVIHKQFDYNNGITFSVPLNSIEEVQKVTANGFEPVDLSNVTLAADGLSITITGADDGDNYLVTGLIRSEESTIPETEYSVPLNRSAQIDGNTEMINRLSEETNDLWTTLLPLVDKELAMAGIATITTDMSADANDDELKNKINEILNVWV